jgi:hypothetical protein
MPCKLVTIVGNARAINPNYIRTEVGKDHWAQLLMLTFDSATMSLHPA